MNRTAPTTSPTRHDPWLMLRRHRMRFALTATAAAAVTLVAGFFMPRQYQAEAVFERRNDMVLTELAQNGATRSFQNPRQALVKELTGDVSVDTTIDHVAAELASRGRTLDAMDRERLRADLRRRLHVGFDFATDPADRIRLTFTGYDPLIAQLAVNHLVETYIEQTRSGMDERLRESASFFTGEVQRFRDMIAGIEDKLLGFELDNTQLMPDNPHSIHAQVAEGRKRLAEARQHAESARLQIEALTEQLQQTPQKSPTVTRTRNPELTRLEDRLRTLGEQRSRHLLVDRMKPEHPDLIAIEEQMKAIRGQIETTETEVVSATTYTDNPRHAEVSLLLARARGEEQAAVGRIATIEQELAEMARMTDELYPVRAEYNALTREKTQAQRQLNFWEDNLRRVQMTLSAEHGNRGVQLSFIRPCGPISRPSSPSFMQLLMAAVLAAGAAGGLSVFVAHRNDPTVQSPDHLAKALGLPLLGTVGPVVTAAQARVRWFADWVVAPIQIGAMAAVVLLLAGVSYVALERPDLWERFQDKTEQVTISLGLARGDS